MNLRGKIRLPRSDPEFIPFEIEARRWSSEVYFETPISTEKENASELVQVGDVAYWPPGRVLCLFFGPTPVNKPGEVRSANSVNVVSKVIEGLNTLKKVKDGEKVRLEIL